MKNIFYLFCILSFLFSSCSPYSYFTKGNKMSVESSGMSLKKLQFYIDRKIELRREVTSEEAKLLSGRIKFINGKYVNIIYLKKFTPGVCEESNENNIVVTFETGYGKSITFNSEPIDDITFNKLANNKKIEITKGREVYSIVGNNWSNVNGNIYNGIIKYDNFDYLMKYSLHHWVRYDVAGPYQPSLLIKKNHDRFRRVERRRVKGKMVK